MKFFGSKSKLAKSQFEAIMKEFDIRSFSAYVEPFFGSGAMMNHVIKTLKKSNLYDGFKKFVALDINKPLIAMHDSIIRGWLPPENISEEEYMEMLENPLGCYTHNSSTVGYAGHCFSRFGKYLSGDYQCGLNGYNKSTYKDLKWISDYRETFKDVLFIESNYASLLSKDVFQFRKGPVLVYCDPPRPSFDKTFYNKDFDTQKFWEWAKETSLIPDISLVVSEYSAPEDWSQIWEQQKPVKTKLILPKNRALHGRNGKFKGSKKLHVTPQRVEKLFVYMG